MKTSKNIESANVIVNDGKISISYLIVINKKSETHFSCSIPAFNIKFSTTDDNLIESKSRAFIGSFIDYYLKKESFNAFILQIIKLGFKADKHIMTSSDLLKGKSRHGKFKTNFRENFSGSKVVTRKSDSLQISY